MGANLQPHPELNELGLVSLVFAILLVADFHHLRMHVLAYLHYLFRAFRPLRLSLVHLLSPLVRLDLPLELLGRFERQRQRKLVFVLGGLEQVVHWPQTELWLRSSLAARALRPSFLHFFWGASLGFLGLVCLLETQLGDLVAQPLDYRLLVLLLELMLAAAALLLPPHGLVVYLRSHLVVLL